MRAFVATPAESVAWLSEPLPQFGQRLGAVLFRVPANVRRPEDGSGDARLEALLAAWPPAVPLALEFQDQSWHVDETFKLLRAASAALVATELLEDEAPPTIRRTSGFLYLRLRRHDYTGAEIDAWAARLAPFLEAGDDAFAFFRHDETGRATELARALAEAVSHLVPDAAGPARSAA